MVWCVNIFHLTWPASPPYLVKPRCSEVLHNVEMYYLQQSIWRLNYHTVNWIWFIWLKIVRIRARNVPSKRTQAPRWRRVSRISLSLSIQDSDGVACWCAEVPSCWNIKNRLRTTCACLAVVSEQESCRDSMPFLLWHQIWAIWL